jgi:hypothetical protein
MKGDIAVAGFMMTAEEWQALDVASRAQLVDVITRKDPQIATGSGPVVVEPRLASGTLPPTNVALAEGTNPGTIVAVGDASDLDVPDQIEELPSGAVIIDPS